MTTNDVGEKKGAKTMKNTRTMYKEKCTCGRYKGDQISYKRFKAYEWWGCKRCDTFHSYAEKSIKELEEIKTKEQINRQIDRDISKTSQLAWKMLREENEYLKSLIKPKEQKQ